MVTRQCDNEEPTIRVYKYGLVPIGHLDERAIEELWRANKMWNKLVELHYQNRADWEKARCAANPQYLKITTDLAALNEKISKAYDDKRTARMNAGTRDTSHPLISAANDKIKTLKAKRSAIYEELKPIREKTDRDLNQKTLNEAFNSQINAACRVSGTGGLYSITSDEVRKNFKNAREQSFTNKRGKLRFHRFDGTGFFAFRFRRNGANVDGVSFKELFQGSTPNEQRFTIVRQDNSRKKTRLRLRAKLVGGAKRDTWLFQEFDLIYHRPIPENGQIQNRKIMRTRVGDRFKYHAVLTVKQPKPYPPVIPENKAIGIDIGFRHTKDSILAVTIIFDDEQKPPREIIVPPKMIKGFKHVIDLQGILDGAASDLGKVIKPILNENPLGEDHKKYGLWRAAAKYPNNVTLSFETAYKLARYLKYDPDFIPEKAAKAVHEWWRAYSRRYREMHNLRAKQLLNRKHFYREVASNIVSYKRLIVLENINLTAFAEAKDKDNSLNNKARAQRFLVSVSEFRDAIINAANRETVPIETVPAQYTSKKCSACGNINKALESEKTWTCPACGVDHNRDINAAKNIAALGKDRFKKRKKEKN